MGQLEKKERQNLINIKEILLVEDDKLCYKFMINYLNRLNFQVDLVTDSLAATQNIDSKIYDLIIIDNNLYGNLSGEEIIKNVRTSTLNIGSPIILWSSYINENENSVENKYSSWGADLILIKNCGFKGLENAIQKCFLMPRNERESFYKLKIL